MLELLATKEKPEFSVFYSENLQRTVQYIYKKLGNQQDAEDLAGDVFLYCYSNYENYDPRKSSLNTWLYLIVNSRIKNYYRDRRIYTDLDDVVGIIPDESNDMDACIYLEQATSHVRKAIDRLPEKQRRVVILRYFEEKTSEQIAGELGITPGNARVLLSRAIDTLEKMCADFVKGEN